MCCVDVGRPIFAVEETPEEGELYDIALAGREEVGGRDDSRVGSCCSPLQRQASAVAYESDAAEPRDKQALDWTIAARRRRSSSGREAR